nr:hypothetical protein [Solirubrobacterales bacterium]
MKKRLTLTVAFAMLVMALIVGTVQAGGGALGTGSGPVDVQVPDGSELPDLPGGGGGGPTTPTVPTTPT